MDIEGEKSAVGGRERGKRTNTMMAEPIRLQSLGGADALGGVPVEHRPHEGQALRRHSLAWYSQALRRHSFACGTISIHMFEYRAQD